MTNQQKHSRSIPKSLPNYSWGTPQVLLRHSKTITNILKSGQSNQSPFRKDLFPRTMLKYIPAALLNSLFDYQLKTIVKRAKSEIDATTIQIMKAYKKAAN